MVIQLIDMSIEFPYSPDIVFISKKITEAESVICSEDEKASLTALEDEMEESAASIADEVAIVQEQLLTLTGTTLPSSTETSSEPTKTTVTMTTTISTTDSTNTSGVLIVGGLGSSYLSSAEVYNPYIGTTCSVGDLPSARLVSSLCNGMVCGGYPETK